MSFQEDEVSPSWLQGVEGPTVDFIESDARVIRGAAGPGTGKTFALMRRIARLLDQRVEPDELLVVTFTRTAARDLVDNLRTIGVSGAEDVSAGTLHSFCFSLLSRDAVLEATSRVPRPLLKHERRVMLADLKHCHGFGIRDSGRLLSAFDAAWARMQSDDPGWPQDEIERRFRDRLIEWLRFHRGMLVGELVPLAREYLRANPRAPARHAFTHVLVDEYQDLNRADQDLIDTLAEGGHLVVIGDEDQSIYTQLRYAQPEGIRDFAASREGTFDVPFVVCRRCPTGVVKIANHLIQHNSDRTPRELEPFPENPDGRVAIYQWQSIEEEAEGLAHLIADAVKAGRISAGRVLVLAPRRVLGYAIRDELNRRGVPAHSYFTEEALDTEAAQEGFTLLGVLADQDDRVALRTWLGFGHSSYAAAPYKYLRAHCEDNGKQPREVLDDLIAGDVSLPYSNHLLERYRLLQTRVAALAEASGQELIDALFLEDATDTEQCRFLATDAQSEAPEPLTAPGLLDGLRTRIVQPELPQEGDFVRVMSLHKSKGLTADLVVVAGCVQGWVPTLDDPDVDREPLVREQRRLFYVAITRPTQQLVISSFRTMPLDLAHKMRVRIQKRTASRAYCVASEFLSELGADAPDPVAAEVGTTL